MRNTLQPHELAAIQRYAAENGRKWKAALELDWYHARARTSDPLDAGALQAIRNDCGPRWLASFKLADQAKAGA